LQTSLVRRNVSAITRKSRRLTLNKNFRSSFKASLYPGAGETKILDPTNFKFIGFPASARKLCISTVRSAWLTDCIEGYQTSSTRKCLKWKTVPNCKQLEIGTSRRAQAKSLSLPLDWSIKFVIRKAIVYQYTDGYLPFLVLLSEPDTPTRIIINPLVRGDNGAIQSTMKSRHI